MFKIFTQKIKNGNFYIVYLSKIKMTLNKTILINKNNDIKFYLKFSTKKKNLDKRNKKI